MEDGYFESILRQNPKNNSNLKFTGERFIPDHPELLHLYQEHVIRYMFAAQFVKSKTVLDAGCGAGYGSYLLSQQGVEKIIGIDNSDESIDYCKKKYRFEKLEFKVSDCNKLEFNNSTFDVIIAFELIEHLQEPEKFLVEVKRILRKDGIFILSTPNKKTYLTENKFHVREYEESELKFKLKSYFSNVDIFYQTYPSTMSINKPGQDKGIKELDFQSQFGKQTEDDALYFVAVCSNDEIPKIIDKLFLFDEKTTLLENYPGLIRWTKILQEDIKSRSVALENLQKEFDERTSWALDLQKELKEKDEVVTSLQKEFDERTSWALDLQKELKEKDEVVTSLQNELLQKDEETTSLQKEFDERTIWGLEVQKESLQKDEAITSLQKEFETKDSQLEELQSKFYCLENSMEEIKSSVLFKSAFKIAKTLDKIFPLGTRRAEGLRLIKTSIQIVQNEGLLVLARSVKEKLKRTRIVSRGFSKNRFDETSLYDLKKRKNIINIIYPEYTKPDKTLREFINAEHPDMLRLPRYPKISIIISTYNQVKFLKKNLESIENKTTYKNYEIIIVTNNQDKGSDMRKFLGTIKYKILVFNDTYSFSAVNNFASLKSDGEFLIFLNDDVEVISPNWIESMLKLGLDDNVAAVGPKLLFSDGRLQEAGCIVWKDGIAWNYGRNSNPNEPDFNYVRSVDYCSASCLMIKRKIFDQLGGFDTSYYPAYCEDADLCLSAQQLGYKILYQPLAVLIHHEGKTQGTDITKGIKSHQIENQKKFREKWKNYLNSRLGDSPNNAFTERDRKSGINILYIDHYVPEFDKDSGSLTAFYVMSILSHLENRLIFWPDNRKKTKVYTTALEQKGIEVMYGNKSFESFIKERKNDFQICMLSRVHIAPKYIDLIKRYSPNCRIVYETVDLHFIRELREANLTGSTRKISNALQTKKIELNLIQKSDLTIVKSEEEADFLLKEKIDFSSAIIPPFQIPSSETPSFEERKDLIFVGGFQHPPNIDSLEYLVKKIFPKIKQKLPEIKLLVIGSNPTEKIINLCSNVEGVVFIGYVKNIEPYLNKSKILLAPLRYGAGVKGKITQSMSHGLVVITSPIGAEGISNGRDNKLIIANNEDEFVEKTINVYNDKQLWTKISNYSKICIETKFSPEQARNVLEQIINFCCK